MESLSFIRYYNNISKLIFLPQLFSFISSHDLGYLGGYITAEAEYVQYLLEEIAEIKREAETWLEDFLQTEWTSMTKRICIMSQTKTEPAIMITTI